MATWLNGERIDGPRALFDLADRGLLLGDGVFETILVLNGRAAFRDAHLRRLADACETLAIPLDPAKAAEATDRAAGAIANGTLRLTVTRGSGPRGLAPPTDQNPTILATSAAADKSPAFASVRLWTTPIRRNETSPTSRLKTLNYLDAIVAAGEARRNGCDEALFLNGRGRVACAGTGNLFALKNGRLRTPPVAEGVLPGVTRAAVLRSAPVLGLDAGEAPLGLSDLLDAEAVFMTNSLRLIAPVEAIGARRLPMPRPPVIRALAEALCHDLGQDCGPDPRFHLRPSRLDPDSGP